MASMRKKAALNKEVDLSGMVKSGNQDQAYEALQLYRSKALRYKSKGDMLNAIQLTASGSICFLENQYETAGSELAALFLELVSDTKEMSEDLRDKSCEIDDRFKTDSIARVEYLRSTVKLTVTCGTKELGDPMIHTRLAECLWYKYDKHCYYHFAAGEVPLLFCRLIFERFVESSQSDSRDRALIIGITNFLALENLRDAYELFYQYQRNNKSKNYNNQTKLIQFCDYLLQTCRRDAAPLFKQLVNAYASLLDFDESVPTLLMGPIAIKFFNIKPKVNPMMSMIQTMLA